MNKTKSKLNFFSKEELKNFILNLDCFFEINFRNLDELHKALNQSNLSVVFLESEKNIPAQLAKNFFKNENFFFVCKNFETSQNLPLIQKNTIISPTSVNKLVDSLNNFINTRKLSYLNVEIKNNVALNFETNEKIHLTQTENLIILDLFKEKEVEKNILKSEILQIRNDLNTSSIESHLNRIRKKLKKIESQFTISSKGNLVRLEMVNQDT